VHQTAYKGLLRLSELFTGIQEEVLGHGAFDNFFGRRPFLSTASNNWIIRSYYRNNSIYFAYRVHDDVFYQHPFCPAEHRSSNYIVCHNSGLRENDCCYVFQQIPKYNRLLTATTPLLLKAISIAALL
jgi:hypothetical protein